MAKPPTHVSNSNSPPEKKTKRARLHQDPPPPRQDHSNSVPVANSDSNANASTFPDPLVNSLPEDILEKIFSFLPIQHAVQIGTLASRFKSSWFSNRNFLFGRDFTMEYDQRDIVELLDRVFDSHQGSKIQTFRLYIDPAGVELSIANWLRICIEKEVEELDLSFLRPAFTLGPCSIDIQTLRSLKLINCAIELPPVLRGLQFLHTLILRQLQLTEAKLQVLVLRCKLLKTLDLCQCSGIRQADVFARHHRHFKKLRIACCPDLEGIEIDAPTLRSVFYCGVVVKIQFAQVLPLIEAFFNFLPTRSYMQPSKLESLVNDLSRVSVLTTSALFPEALTARFRNGRFRDMQFSLWNLKELQLFMEGATFCNPYDIAMFLKRCPCLERLFIDLSDYSFECGLYWELHQKAMFESISHYFLRLRFVKLNCFKFQRYEIELIKLLLKKAIFLEVLIFIAPRNGRTKLYRPEDAIIYNQLFHSWKASPTARIVFLEHIHDKCSPSPSHPKYWY